MWRKVVRKCPQMSANVRISPSQHIVEYKV